MKANNNMNLETPFSNGKWAIGVATVGQLIEELKRLPADLPIGQDGSNGADIVVFNRDSKKPFVELQELGMWDEIDETE